MWLEDLKAFRLSHRFDVFPFVLSSAQSVYIDKHTSEWYSSNPRLKRSYKSLGEVVITSACLCISVCSTLLWSCEWCPDVESLCVKALTDSFVCVDILPHHISEIPNSFLTWYQPMVTRILTGWLLRVTIWTVPLHFTDVFFQSLLVSLSFIETKRSREQQPTQWSQPASVLLRSDHPGIEQKQA